MNKIEPVCCEFQGLVHEIKSSLVVAPSKMIAGDQTEVDEFGGEQTATRRLTNVSTSTVKSIFLTRLRLKVSLSLP